jgi:hypothetical protein
MTENTAPPPSITPTPDPAPPPAPPAPTFAPIGRPALADSTIQQYRDMLTLDLERDYPAHAAMIRSTLEAALKASGQDQAPAPDLRTPEQRFHDSRMSVAPGALPDSLAALVATGEPGTIEQTRTAIEGMGRSYSTVLADAKAALAHGQLTADPEKLSAAVLLQLSIYGQHLARWSHNRPKGA